MKKGGSSKATIDERFDRFVDRACIAVPKAFRFLGIKLAKTALGWHLCVLIVSFRNVLRDAFIHVRSEKDMDMLLSDTAEKLTRMTDSATGFFIKGAHWLLAIDEAGPMLRFHTLLFLLLVNSFGVLFNGKGELSAVGACICFLWLANCFETGYGPVCTGIRQRYIAQLLCSAMASLSLLLTYFSSYLQQRISVSNAVLQLSMILMVMVHFVLFLALIAFNHRQPLLLRIISFLLGVLPALTVAAGISLAMILSGQGNAIAILSFVRVIGLFFYFMLDRLESFYSLGAVRLRYLAFWQWLLTIFSLVPLMLVSWYI